MRRPQEHFYFILGQRARWRLSCRGVLLFGKRSEVSSILGGLLIVPVRAGRQVVEEVQKVAVGSGHLNLNKP